MIQYQILKTGFFYADGGAMFGAVPKRAWSRKYPSDEQNCCILAMNCILLRDDNHLVLLDTGVGTKDLGNLSYYRFYDTENIVDLVRKQGFEPEQVTEVILSHLHFDHCGGCTFTNKEGRLELAFPRALHYVGKSQWENYLHPNPLEKDSFRAADMIPVAEQNLLRLVENDFELLPGLTIELHDGHTPGQLVSFFETENRRILFPADVFPTKAHLSDEWISAYDTHPLNSLTAKTCIKNQIKDKPVSIVFYHDAYHPLVVK
jgi:glyoxylase-like metal-dependent hydrolase (beta-lactamase superfamily II)